jgi:hypothetical protein
MSSSPHSALGPRIAIVGSTGSGKTTLAQQLAQALHLPHVELDALYWGPGWTETPRDEFRQRVRSALDGSSWVTDGNYGKARDIIWERATDLIWLDYSLPLIWSRLFRRPFTAFIIKRSCGAATGKAGAANFSAATRYFCMRSAVENATMKPIPLFWPSRNMRTWAFAACAPLGKQSFC